MPRTNILTDVAVPSCLSCHIMDCQTVIVPDGGPAIDPFLGYKLDGTLPAGPTDPDVVGVPQYGGDASDLSGAIPLDLSCVALVTDGVVIIQVEPTTPVASGIRVAFNAAGQIAPAGTGEYSIGYTIDESTTGGTVPVPHYVRVKIDRMQII